MKHLMMARTRALKLTLLLLALGLVAGVSFAAPPAPTGLWAYPSTSTQIYVAWDEVATATNYTLQWKETSQNTWNEIAGFPYTSYQHLDRKCNTSYSYRVAATSLQSGQSPWSNTVSATTLACPPGPSAPANLNATAKSQSEIGLTWSDVSGETGYEVEYSNNGSNWSLLHVTGASQTSMNDVALACNTLRYYRVRAVNDNGKSNYSNTDSATTFACDTPEPVVIDLLKNGDFEARKPNQPKLPANWTPKGTLSGDTLVGKNYGEGYFVYDGERAWLFRSPGGTKDFLFQGVNMNKFAFGVGDKLTIGARINHVRGANESRLVWVKITYSDGTSTDLTLNTQADLDLGFVYRGNFTTLQRSDITAIVVRLGYNRANGKLAIDDVSLSLTKAPASLANSAPTSDQWTPLPVPADMRGN